MFVEVEPPRLVHQAAFHVGSVERFKDEVGDGSGFSVGLEQLVHAVKHGKCSEGDGGEHHHGDAERLPRGLLLEHSPIGLFKQAHTGYWKPVIK